MAKPDLTRVAHVDDDLSIREVARLALEAIGGFTVLSCASGQKALQQIPAFAPQLILLDVMMPGLDGPAMLKQLSCQMDLSRIPVVFMSAKSQNSAPLDFGSVYYEVAKPFDPMALADQIRMIYAAH